MSAAEVLHQLEAAGVRVAMPEPERLRVIGGDDACATTLTDAGYSPPEWTRHHAAHMAASVPGRRAEHLRPVDPGPLTHAAPDRRMVRAIHIHPLTLTVRTS